MSADSCGGEMAGQCLIDCYQSLAQTSLGRRGYWASSVATFAVQGASTECACRGLLAPPLCRRGQAQVGPDEREWAVGDG